MAQFYGDLRGNRGQTTRMGTKGSGITAHLRGWQVGARVVVSYDPDRECDVVRVYRTSGSSGYSSDRLIAEFWEDDE